VFEGCWESTPLFRAARLALKIAACRKFDLGGTTCDDARGALPQVSAPRFAFRHRLREGVFDAHDHGHAGTKLDALRYRQFLPRYFNAFIDAEPLICDCEKVEEGMPELDDDKEGMPVLLDGASDDDIR
jgi:hypothetical protein